MRDIEKLPRDISLGQMFTLANSMDDVQAYFMQFSENHKQPITITFDHTQNQVIVYVGSGDEMKIGFGSSVAYAVGDAFGYTNKLKL